MPANLTPEYLKAEELYRKAVTDEERLEALKLMLATIPKHKGTEKLQAEIKRKISQITKSLSKKTGPSRGPDAFQIPKKGLPQVVLIGYPNVGKSSLFHVVTHAPAKIGVYPYTTIIPQPGIWDWQKAKVELIDTPPIEHEKIPSGLLGTIRNSDLLCVVIDLTANLIEQIETTVQLCQQKMIEIRSQPRDTWITDPWRQKPVVFVLNKVDLIEREFINSVKELLGSKWRYCFVSAVTLEGLEDWFKNIWELLAMIRVYTKEPGKEPDLQNPFILPKGATIEDLARKIHKELPQRMTYARIWGEGRLPGQMVPKEELLKEGDIVQIHAK